MRDRLTFAAIAAAALAARLPFLLRADRFFDADEAVEGLMARHLGDQSFFLWGQRYKGTPEVFLSSAAFRVFGSNVIALKAVTLACFIVFLCLNFRLLERMFSRGIAWSATAFLIIGPPSLVLWTLSGSAEVVMTLLAGAVLLLGVESWRRSGSRPALLVAAAACGFGLWVQQYILYYVVCVGIVLAADWPRLPPEVRVSPTPSWVRRLLALLGTATALYILLGLAAFFTGGFDVRLAGVRITATHPQKMWWIAGAILGLTILVSMIAMFRAQLVKPAIAFLAGYSPAIVGRIGNHGLGAPISRMDHAAFHHALPDITKVMLPMLFGWRDPAGRPTVVPVVGIALLLVAGLSYWHTWRRKLPPVFHIFGIVAAVMFLVSGSYIDAQSYRYLMPIYAALPVIYAVGIDGLWRTSRVAGALMLTLALAVFAAQQVEWYRRLTPDLQTRQAIACLDGAGIRAARAPYWQSYTVTFLTGERIIVSPTDGIDRYAPYSDATRDAPTVASVSTSRRCS